MRTFKKDRLYTSDRDRMDNLTGSLKKNRIIDDQQSSAFNTYYGSPNKTTQGKNFGPDGSKISPSKISPSKQAQS